MVWKAGRVAIVFPAGGLLWAHLTFFSLKFPFRNPSQRYLKFGISDFEI
jgi:hypothetical protein